MLFASTLASHADTTTDNLLNNPNFTTDTSGWELSDNNQNKVKRDPATYSGSASKSVRFRYQGGSISQDVDISGVSENHLIKEINMNFDSIGCGNTGSQWCNAGADDTVVSTITLSTESTSEVLSETTAVPYEDGWESYSFTKDVTGDFNTDDTSLNLTITGNDTGNSSNWYGPIIDNLSLSLTIEEYVAPVVIEPIVVQPIIEPLVVEPIVEPIIEPIVIIEETLIEGLTLDTEIVNDVILQPVAIEIPTLPDLPDLPEVSEISPEVPEVSELPEISMDIEIPEISVDVSEISIEVPEIEVVEEIQEIEVSEPVVEEIAEVELETPEELKESNMEEDVKEGSTNDEPEEMAEQEAETETETNENSELSDSSEAEVKSDESKVVKKSKSKDSKTKKKDGVKKETAKNTPSKTTKTNKPKAVAKVKKPATNADNLGQIDITTMVYLQVIPQTITIQETISLTQENIYEQDVGTLASSATYDSLKRSSRSRFNGMVDVRPKHSFSGYGR